MKNRIIILLAMLTATTAAFAHRLNEYLVATTINLSGGKVQLQLHLTSGVDVANEVLKSIDQNGDRLISSREQQAYIALLAHDLSLTLDGHRLTLQPVSFFFPTVDAMRKGTGEILVEFESEMSPGVSSPAGSSTHRLELSNDHYRPIAVYLVNCLMPADAGIKVDHQNRSADQSLYQLEFSTGEIQPGMAAGQQRSMAKSDRLAEVRTYFVDGIRHILTGYDHLLFLCALILGAASLWDLIKIVTAFTIAHSITLTLATFGLAHLPSYIVEPFISASIVFIAAQNVFYPHRTSGAGRLAAAFFFGLFHGLGFAGGLLELMHAMPSNLIVYAILGFSLGVEAGNQLVLLPLYGILKGANLFRGKNSMKKPFRLQRFASGLVAIAGLYFLFVALSDI
jgi:hydrogenase/urease accessory protein HupE